MSNPVFFSVVVPSYNRAHLVGKTIDSVLAQRYNDYELIVVDDGSVDNTKEVLKKYSHNSRFRYFKKDNGERGAARNYGFNKSKGEYVFFIDSDDLMLENHLEVLNRHIQSLPEAPDFIASGFVIINPDGSFNYSGHPFKKGWYDKRILLKGNPFACLVAVRKDNPALIPFCEDSSLAVMEDWIFLMENLQKSSLYVLDEVTINMVEHDERSMADNLSVITKRQKASAYILDRVILSQREKKILRGYSNYFCAVHATIEGRKGMALSFLSRSFFQIPIKKSASLLTKLIVGKKAFRWIKRIIGTS